MILGIGTDIIEIARISRAIERQGEAFAKRILTPNEMAVYRGHHQADAYLAKRFAAKEALAKALGTGIAKGVGFQQMETSHDEQGAPMISLLGEGLVLQQQKGIERLHLSLSDEKAYAVAFVIAES